MTLQVQRFILRSLLACDGVPMPDNSLLSAALEALQPRPLVIDYQQARNLLENGGFISGDRDMDQQTITWTLTPKGTHRAKQLQ